VSKALTPKARGYSSVGRAPALQAGGHEFESHYLHQRNFYVSRMYLENHITQVKDEKTENETKGSMQTNESAKCLRLLGSNYH
jgi:hypothetical protein